MSFDLLTISSKNNLEIHPTALTLQFIVDLWNRDKSNNKEKALQELSFIHWMYNYSSLFYKGYPEEKERQLAVQEYVFKNTKWKPDKEVLNAAKQYKELQDLAYPALSDLRTAKKTLGALKQFLDELDPNERTNAGGLVLKPSDIYTAIAKMGDALKAVDEMEKKVKEQLDLKSSKIKGGGKQGTFEDGDDLDYLKK